MPVTWLAPLRGALALTGYTLNTLAIGLPLLAVALAKWLIPLHGWRMACGRLLNAMASSWIAVNNLNLRLLSPTCWRVEGLEGLDPRGWHLVVSNHQSWVDILVLQKVFHRRIPFLKFFLKQELIWVPVLGLAWWALDFPFMKRYSKARLARKPHLKGRDLAITRQACSKFRHIPVSIMNFVEGTRLSPEKQRGQASPYRHLLRPKTGGMAMVLAAMGEQLDRVVDVTIVYPQGAVNFWSMLCGRLREVIVRVKALPVPPDLVALREDEENLWQATREWLDQLWQQKDRAIAALMREAALGTEACTAPRPQPSAPPLESTGA
jgi:1-acyl-sn-glycerol-3-phosphate acyltransferase